MRKTTDKEKELIRQYKLQHPEPEFPEPIPGLLEIMEHPLFNMKIDFPTLDEFYGEDKKPLMIDDKGRASRDFSKGEPVYQGPTVGAKVQYRNGPCRIHPKICHDCNFFSQKVFSGIKGDGAGKCFYEWKEKHITHWAQASDRCRFEEEK